MFYLTLQAFVKNEIPFLYKLERCTNDVQLSSAVDWCHERKVKHSSAFNKYTTEITKWWTNHRPVLTINDAICFLIFNSERHICVQVGGTSIKIRVFLSQLQVIHYNLCSTEDGTGITTTVVKGNNSHTVDVFFYFFNFFNDEQFIDLFL